MVGNVIGIRGWAKGLFGTSAVPAAPTVPVPSTVLHITHQKAGSQWINRIFHLLVYDRMVHPENEVVPTHDLPVEATQFLRRPVEAGKVYPTLYLTREQFATARVPAGAERFVVIRDPRDTLVSAYFSCKKTHAVQSDWLQNCRAELNRLSPEAGLMFMLDHWLPTVATFQWSWVAAGDRLIKYEDLLTNDEVLLERVLLDQCKLGVDRERFREVVRATRFEAWSGRSRGNEDKNSHERKGIAGDWKNYFTERVSRAFRSRYGSLLVATGYERDERW